MSIDQHEGAATLIAPDVTSSGPIAAATAPAPVSAEEVDWHALEADPDYRALASRKGRLTLGLLLLSLVLYFAFHIVGGFYPELLRPKVFGAINVGLLFAIGELFAAFVIALVYVQVANGEFDAASRRILDRYHSRRAAP